MRPHASSPAQAPVIPATEAFVEAGRVHTTTVRRAVGGDCAGDVDWRPVGKTGTIEIGVWLPPAHRGHGVGTEAQRQLVEYLFATSPVHRLQAGPRPATSPSNAPSNASASSAKACFEACTSETASTETASCTACSATNGHADDGFVTREGTSAGRLARLPRTALPMRPACCRPTALRRVASCHGRPLRRVTSEAR